MIRLTHTYSGGPALFNPGQVCVVIPGNNDGAILFTSNDSGTDAAGWHVEESLDQIADLFYRHPTTDEGVEQEARAMAEAINGGSWDRDYTDAQKAGWRLKVKWSTQRYRKD
jgi:hypothetical protein